MGNKNCCEEISRTSLENSTFIPVSEEVGATIQNFTGKFNDDKLHSICNRWKIEHRELFKNLLSNITDIGLRVIIIEREHKI